MGSAASRIYAAKSAGSLSRTAKRENEEGGLSGGAIAAIVIAAVLVVLVLLCVLYTKGNEISKFVEKVKNMNNMRKGTEKTSYPIAPLPKPLIWTCLDDESKSNIQSSPNIKSNKVYTFYNNNMLFYNDQGTLRQFETSGLTRPPKKWFSSLKRLSWRSKNGANNDETYTTIIKKFPEGEGELTLPNSGLQSDVPAYELQEGEWCFAEQV